MKKKLIIINGVMGVGKTTVSKKLYKSLKGAFWLDGDNVWEMNPFVVNEENKKMVLDNIAYILNSFLRNSSCKYVVFNWVIPTDEVMEEILKRLDITNVEVYKYTLICTKEELFKRIRKDVDLKLRDEGNFERSLKRYELYNRMNTEKIDTTNREVDYIVKLIKEKSNN